MNVLIADDHELLAQAVAESLSNGDGFTVTVTTSLAGAIKQLDVCTYDIILLDLRMPGMSGLSSVESIVRLAKDSCVVLFSGQIDKQFLDDAVALGAKGYIPKSMPLKSLVVSLKLIGSGQTFIPHMSLERSYSCDTSSVADVLTERELLVLRLASEGLINKEIARDIGVSEARVKMIMRQVCRKLGSRNRAHACIVARERMLI